MRIIQSIISVTVIKDLEWSEINRELILISTITDQLVLKVNPIVEIKECIFTLIYKRLISAIDTPQPMYWSYISFVQHRWIIARKT